MKTIRYRFLLIIMMIGILLQPNVNYGATTVDANEIPTQLTTVIIGTKNYVVPESISNMNAKIIYGTSAKKVSYTIDLSEICRLELNSKEVFKSLDLSKAIVEVEDKAGREIVRADSKKYEVSTEGDKLIIKVKDENTIINSGDFHSMNIYFPTSFGERVIYHRNKVAGETYMDLLTYQIDHPVKVSLDICRYPKVREVVEVEGKIIEDEEYASVPMEDTIDIVVTLREMPTIY